MSDRQEVVTGAPLWYAVRDMGDVSGAALLLLYSLCSRINKQEQCWSGYELLVAETRLSSSALKRASRELVNDGWIKKRVRRNRSNLWTVNTERIYAAAQVARLERKRSRSREESNDSGEPEPDLQERVEVPEEEDNEQYNFRVEE